MRLWNHNCVLLRKSYFKKNSSFVKILDIDDVNKQSQRTHLCVMIRLDKNKFFIPLRNNLGQEIRKFGRIGHAVPSKKRKSAGLDYRYTLIVNDESYVELQTEKKIPNAQYKIIKNDYSLIQSEFEIYLKGFIRAVRKGRNKKEPLYKESSLVNFLNELDLDN